MPFVKQELFNFLSQQMLSELKKAQSELWDNKRKIKELSEKQKYLKKKCAHVGRLMMEFQKRKKEKV